MDIQKVNSIFEAIQMSELFPPDTADKFFEALYADTEEGAYGIRLEYKGVKENALTLEFELYQRPGKCLACSLTYGLPTVFTRHPVINIKGLVNKIDKELNGEAKCGEWQLGRTMPLSDELHVIPLSIKLV